MKLYKILKKFMGQQLVLMWAIEMKKNISALAALFYILTVPITQADIAGGFGRITNFYCTEGSRINDKKGEVIFGSVEAWETACQNRKTDPVRESLVKPAMPEPKPAYLQSKAECVNFCKALCSRPIKQQDQKIIWKWTQYDADGDVQSLYPCDNEEEEWQEIFPKTCAGEEGSGRCPYVDGKWDTQELYCGSDGSWARDPKGHWIEDRNLCFEYPRKSQQQCEKSGPLRTCYDFQASLEVEEEEEVVVVLPDYDEPLKKVEPYHVRHCLVGDEERFVLGAREIIDAGLEELVRSRGARYPVRGGQYGLERGRWSNVIGQKNSARNTYLPIGRASPDNQTPSWIRIQLKNTDESKLEYAHVTRIEVKLKDIQMLFDCSGIEGRYNPETCEAMGGSTSADHFVRAMVVNDYNLGGYGVEGIQKFWDEGIEFSDPSDLVVRDDDGTSDCESLQDETRNLDKGIAQGRFEEFSTIVWNDCRDKQDGCSSLTFDFTRSNKIFGIEGEICDTIQTSPVKSKYVYIWFPHGFMHIWSISIYHQPTCTKAILKLAQSNPGWFDQSLPGVLECTHPDEHARYTDASCVSNFKYGVLKVEGHTGNPYYDPEAGKEKREYSIPWPYTDKQSLFVTENGVEVTSDKIDVSSTGNKRMSTLSYFGDPPSGKALIEWSTVQPGACLTKLKPTEASRRGQQIYCHEFTTSKDCRNTDFTKGACEWLD